MSIFSFLKAAPVSTAFSCDTNALRFVSLQKTREGIQVVAYGTEKLGGHIIDDTDKIVDDAQFVKRLKSVALRHNITTANVVIPDGQAIMFHTHVAKLAPEKSMGDVIMDHIKTHCQANNLLALAEYICEYDVILETGYGYDIHVTLVPRLYVAHLVRLFKQAGIVVPHIETAHHAVARSCIHLSTGQGYVSVSVGADATSVALIHGNHLVSREVVAVGVETVLSVIKKRLAIEQREALNIINRHGVLRTHPDNRLLSDIMMTLSPIAQSVDRLLVQHGQIPYKIFGQRFHTEALIVYGQGADIKGLVGLLGEQTGLSARALDVWAGHEADRAPILTLPATETPMYAEALSLALLYLREK